MKRIVSIAALMFALLFSLTVIAEAQVQWIVGGKMGISIGSLSISQPAFAFFAPAQSTTSTSAGFTIGPEAEVVFSRQFAITTEFDINTQAGTPIVWQNNFKVFFPITGSKILPYADAGFGLLFVTGGPYFGFQGGGGAMFPIAKNLYVPADLQLGPFFATGATLFWISIRGGIAYVIPS
ncbi:MAG TPA: hypothetical protein VF889_03460 [Bacteroidota bacterium]